MQNSWHYTLLFKKKHKSTPAPCFLPPVSLGTTTLPQGWWSSATASVGFPPFGPIPCHPTCLEQKAACWVGVGSCVDVCFHYLFLWSQSDLWLNDWTPFLKVINTRNWYVDFKHFWFSSPKIGVSWSNLTTVIFFRLVETTIDSTNKNMGILRNPACLGSCSDCKLSCFLKRIFWNPLVLSSLRKKLMIHQFYLTGFVFFVTFLLQHLGLRCKKAPKNSRNLVCIWGLSPCLVRWLHVLRTLWAVTVWPWWKNRWLVHRNP